MDNLIALISYLALTSIAAERFTEIIKRSWLGNTHVNNVVYQVISGLFGAVIAYHIPSSLEILQFNEYVRCIVIGLAVSGGSGMWNDILETITKYKRSIVVD